MSDALPPRLDHLVTPTLHATRLAPLAWALAAIGAAAFAAMLAAGDAPRAWSAILAGMMVPAFLAVGGLFFIAVHSVCGARWTVPFSRIMEGVSAGLPLVLVAFVAVGSVGLAHLYDWAEGNPGRSALFADMHGSKALWMTGLRFLATGTVILGLWLVLWRVLAARSAAANEAARLLHARWSVATLLLLVPTFTLLVWDLLLSLDVRFTSAVFGGYCLVTAIQAFLGALALVLVWLGRKPLAQVARPHLRKDVGTWLVAWSCIVAYISFVQYVIIAFTNLDADTHWFLKRMQHGYGTQAAVEVALRCVLPFALLMSQRLRSHPVALGIAGAAVLAGSWLELHWLIVPEFAPNHYRHPVGPELLVALGFLAGTFLLALRTWRRDGLVPTGDPRLLPAINAEHLR